jgi:hypothetical protein
VAWEQRFEEEENRQIFVIFVIKGHNSI